jgi:hypothetical protein
MKEKLKAYLIDTFGLTESQAIKIIADNMTDTAARLGKDLTSLDEFDKYYILAQMYSDLRGSWGPQLAGDPPLTPEQQTIKDNTGLHPDVVSPHLFPSGMDPTNRADPTFYPEYAMQRLIPQRDEKVEFGPQAELKKAAKAINAAKLLQNIQTISPVLNVTPPGYSEIFELLVREGIIAPEEDTGQKIDNLIHILEPQIEKQWHQSAALSRINGTLPQTQAQFMQGFLDKKDNIVLLTKLLRDPSVELDYETFQKTQQQMDELEQAEETRFADLRAAQEEAPIKDLLAFYGANILNPYTADQQENILSQAAPEIEKQFEDQNRRLIASRQEPMGKADFIQELIADQGAAAFGPLGPPPARTEFIGEIPRGAPGYTPYYGETLEELEGVYETPAQKAAREKMLPDWFKTLSQERIAKDLPDWDYEDLAPDQQKDIDERGLRSAMKYKPDPTDTTWQAEGRPQREIVDWDATPPVPEGFLDKARAISDAGRAPQRPTREAGGLEGLPSMTVPTTPGQAGVPGVPTAPGITTRTEPSELLFGERSDERLEALKKEFAPQRINQIVAGLTPGEGNFARWLRTRIGSKDFAQEYDKMKGDYVPSMLGSQTVAPDANLVMEQRDEALKKLIADQESEIEALKAKFTFTDVLDPEGNPQEFVEDMGLNLEDYYDPETETYRPYVDPSYEAGVEEIRQKYKLIREQVASDYQDQIARVAEYQGKVIRDPATGEVMRRTGTSPIAQLEDPTFRIPGREEWDPTGVGLPDIFGRKTREPKPAMPMPKEYIGGPGTSQQELDMLNAQMAFKRPAPGAYSAMMGGIMRDQPAPTLQQFAQSRLADLRKEFAMSPYGREAAPTPLSKRKITKTFKAPTGPALFGRV